MTRLVMAWRRLDVYFKTTIILYAVWIVLGSLAIFMYGCTLPKHDDAKRLKLLHDCINAMIPSDAEKYEIPGSVIESCQTMSEEDSRL